MKVDIEIERSITIELPPEKVRPLFQDIETTVSRFPKLKKLVRVADNQYVWELSTIGSRMAKIAHDVERFSSRDIAVITPGRELNPEAAIVVATIRALNPRAVLKVLLEQRLPLYREVATDVVDTNGKTVRAVADEVLALRATRA